MARHKDSLLGANSKSYSSQSTTPMVNLAVGGQNGYSTDLMRFHANTDYVGRNLIAKLIEPPRGFGLYGTSEAQEMTNALKGIVEMHAQTWEGLNRTLTVNTVDSPLGGAGEMQQTPSNVVRARSEPTLTVPEKYGSPVRALHEMWITDLIMDPDTKVPGIVARQNAIKPTDLLPDMYSMTVLFFEPDPTFTKVHRAWLVGNMFPLTAGEDVGRRDKTQDGSNLILSIQYTGIQQVGLGVNRFAQKILDSMNVTGTNPNMAPSFVSEIDRAVASSQYGYAEQIAAANATYIRP